MSGVDVDDMSDYREALRPSVGDAGVIRGHELNWKDEEFKTLEQQFAERLDQMSEDEKEEEEEEEEEETPESYVAFVTRLYRSHAVDGIIGIGNHTLGELSIELSQTQLIADTRRGLFIIYIVASHAGVFKEGVPAGYNWTMDTEAEDLLSPFISSMDSRTVDLVEKLIAGIQWTILNDETGSVKLRMSGSMCSITLKPVDRNDTDWGCRMLAWSSWNLKQEGIQTAILPEYRGLGGEGDEDIGEFTPVTKTTLSELPASIQKHLMKWKKPTAATAGEFDEEVEAIEFVNNGVAVQQHTSRYESTEGDIESIELSYTGDGSSFNLTINAQASLYFDPVVVERITHAQADLISNQELSASLTLVSDSTEKNISEIISAAVSLVPQALWAQDTVFGVVEARLQAEPVRPKVFMTKMKQLIRVINDHGYPMNSPEDGMGGYFETEIDNSGNVRNALPTPAIENVLSYLAHDDIKSMTNYATNEGNVPLLQTVIRNKKNVVNAVRDALRTALGVDLDEKVYRLVNGDIDPYANIQLLKSYPMPVFIRKWEIERLSGYYVKMDIYVHEYQVNLSYNNDQLQMTPGPTFPATKDAQANLQNTCKFIQRLISDFKEFTDGKPGLTGNVSVLGDEIQLFASFGISPNNAETEWIAAEMYYRVLSAGYKMTLITRKINGWDVCPVPDIDLRGYVPRVKKRVIVEDDEDDIREAVTVPSSPRWEVPVYPDNFQYQARAGIPSSFISYPKQARMKEYMKRKILSDTNWPTFELKIFGGDIKRIQLRMVNSSDDGNNNDRNFDVEIDVALMKEKELPMDSLIKRYDDEVEVELWNDAVDGNISRKSQTMIESVFDIFVEQVRKLEKKKGKQLERKQMFMQTDWIQMYVTLKGKDEVIAMFIDTAVRLKMEGYEFLDANTKTKRQIQWVTEPPPKPNARVRSLDSDEDEDEDEDERPATRQRVGAEYSDMPGDMLQYILSYVGDNSVAGVNQETNALIQKNKRIMRDTLRKKINEIKKIDPRQDRVQFTASKDAIEVGLNLQITATRDWGYINIKDSDDGEHSEVIELIAGMEERAKYYSAPYGSSREYGVTSVNFRTDALNIILDVMLKLKDEGYEFTVTVPELRSENKREWFVKNDHPYEFSVGAEPSLIDMLSKLVENLNVEEEEVSTKNPFNQMIGIYVKEENSTVNMYLAPNLGYVFKRGVRYWTFEKESDKFIEYRRLPRKVSGIKEQEDLLDLIDLIDGYWGNIHGVDHQIQSDGLIITWRVITNDIEKSEKQVRGFLHRI